ncbi:MAG: hypothetical protein IJY31_00435, partial [Muribaculaceae bacterium]|nr:hypothetical protein [Muribaculaceae bacterium]
GKLFFKTGHSPVASLPFPAGLRRAFPKASAKVQPFPSATKYFRIFFRQKNQPGAPTTFPPERYTPQKKSP